jgi:hypothetical protein
MTDQPAAEAAASAAPEPAVAAAPEAPPPVDKGDLMAGFFNRIDAGEFDQPEDAFHRFVVKEIYPLLGGGTLTAKDLEVIARKYSSRADPYNRPFFEPTAAPKLATAPAK